MEPDWDRLELSLEYLKTSEWLVQNGFSHRELLDQLKIQYKEDPETMLSILIGDMQKTSGLLSENFG